MEVLAEGLQFPEGPIAMGDGSIILVEIRRGTLTRVWNGKTEVIADLGGGPNGAALGPDGAVYVCNNGGGVLVGEDTGRPVEGGRVERVNLSTGKFERVFDQVGENKLSAPNDLVFDKQGGFWFTDFGKTLGRKRDLSGVYYATPGASSVSEISFGGTGYNGIGLAPDESTVYAAETNTGRLIAFNLDAPGKVRKGGRGGRMVGTAPDRAFFDSLAMQANGDVCIASIAHGITTMSPDGKSRFTPVDDRMVTNILLWRRRHEGRLHHRVREGPAAQNALAGGGSEVELLQITRSHAEDAEGVIQHPRRPRAAWILNSASRFQDDCMLFPLRP